MREHLKRASCSIPHPDLSPYTTVFNCVVHFQRPSQKTEEAFCIRIPVTYNGGRRHYDSVKELVELDLLRHVVKEYGSSKLVVKGLRAKEDPSLLLPVEKIDTGLFLTPISLHLKSHFLESCLQLPRAQAQAAMHTFIHGCLWGQKAHCCEACYFAISAVSYFHMRTSEPDPGCCCCWFRNERGGCPLPLSNPSNCFLKVPKPDSTDAWADVNTRSLNRMLQLVDEDIENLVRWDRNNFLSPAELKQLLVHHHFHLSANIVFQTRFMAHFVHKSPLQPPPGTPTTLDTQSEE